MKFVKALIPKPVKRWLRSLWNLKGIFVYYPRDIYRFLRHSAALSPNREMENLNARVIADAHIIEKGLSLKEPRLGFGEYALIRIQQGLNEYHVRSFSTNQFAYNFAASVLKRYIEFNEAHDHDVSKVKESCQKFFDVLEKNIAGLRTFTAEDMNGKVNKPFKEFVEARFSCRQFSDVPVDVDKVIDAVSTARFTPSVCNRQSAHVYIVKDPEKKKEVLRLQQGNRGFGEQIDKVIVVCADLNSFFSYQERHQAYVDGGLFSMSLMYALTHNNIGSCPLNWCTDHKRDKAIRKVVPIKDSEAIIMVIGIGSLPDEFSVAGSPRKDVEEYYKLI